MSSSLTAALIALAGMTGAVGDTPSTGRPIRLDVVESGDKIVLTVVGSSDVAVDAAFKLKVASEGRGGVNRTNQSGRARLIPGKPVTMVTLSVANGEPSKWHATLDVEQDGVHSYTLERGSDLLAAK